MTPRTLQALKASIAKWDKNARVRNLDNAQIGVEDCALCLLFHEDVRGYDEEPCVGCPVAAATREPYCGGSPYVNASHERRFGTPAAFRAAAKAEATFLRSLLPEGETA
jgi:hypothetical protein